MISDIIGIHTVYPEYECSDAHQIMFKWRLT